MNVAWRRPDTSTPRFSLIAPRDGAVGPQPFTGVLPAGSSNGRLVGWDIFTPRKDRREVTPR